MARRLSPSRSMNDYRRIVIDLGRIAMLQIASCNGKRDKFLIFLRSFRFFFVKKKEVISSPYIEKPWKGMIPVDRETRR